MDSASYAVAEELEAEELRRGVPGSPVPLPLFHYLTSSDWPCEVELDLWGVVTKVFIWEYVIFIQYWNAINVFTF